MSKSHILRDLAKREEKAEKEAEKGFVRAEKAADEAIAKKLVETYGAAPPKLDDGRLTRAWRCHECRFANYESRMACANCLAVAPQRGRDGAIVEAPKSIAGAPSTRDTTVVMTRVGERHYRSFAAHGVAMKRALAGAAMDRTAAALARAGGRIAGAAADEEDDANDDGGDVAAGCSTGKEKIDYDNDRRLFVMRLDCPRRYHRFVVGQGAKTLKDIERTASVKLIVPKEDPNDAARAAATKPIVPASAAAPDDDEEEEEVAAAGGCAALALDCVKDVVTIEGNSVAGIRAAQLRIDAIIAEAKDKVDYTHFISIPIGPVPSAKAALTSLLEDMHSTVANEDHGIDESIFQRPARVHITLLMLRLYTQGDLDLARIVLEALEPELQHIFAPHDAVVLQGLATMDADPRAAHVVYMDVARDNVYKRLQALVTRINNAFIDAGIASAADVQNNGKLHATIMNSKWRRGGSRQHQAFNASEALRIFGGRNFGAHCLRSIEINTLGGGSAPDGYFPSVASIRFP